MRCALSTAERQRRKNVVFHIMYSAHCNAEWRAAAAAWINGDGPMPSMVNPDASQA